VVDLLQELGATVHLANPKALNWGDRRVKNDVVDATDLADMLRWVASRRRGSPRRRSVRCGSWSATGPSWCSCAPGSKPRSTR
jgi:hypothetical protein